MTDPVGDDAPALPAVDPAKGTAGSTKADVLAVAVAFTRRLRRAGLDVAVHGTATFAEALDVVAVVDQGAVYWAGRATLVHRFSDLAAYDAEFALFFEGRAKTSDQDVPAESASLGLDADESDGDHGDRSPDDSPPDVAVRFSSNEVLRHRDFAACTADEMAELHRAIGQLRVSGPHRRSRRQRRTHHRGRADLRRTLRDSLHTGGDPLHRRFTTPSERPRRLVLLVDVSASMDPYARGLVRFAHAATSSRRNVEVFTIGTRTTRLTRALTGHEADQALASAAAEVIDWSGGTRLGDGLAAFNDRWGARGLARGATVVILSDGWDRGDPLLLGAEMARLARAAHQVIWVNPLAGVPGYEPTAAGMAAAISHVDHLMSGHSLASLEALAALLASSAANYAERREPLR